MTLLVILSGHAPTSVADDSNALDELDLNELFNLEKVISATKSEQDVRDAPSIVTIISAKDIRQRGFKSVSEALQGVQGLALIDDLVHHNIGVRGLYASPGAASDIIKVMINGQPSSYRPTSGNLLGREFIPMAAIERIEVIRGPASALYGANAFLGVVNIITFQGKQLDGGKPKVFASVRGGAITDQDMLLGDSSVSVASSWQRGAYRYFVSFSASHRDRSGLAIPGLDDIKVREAHDVDPEAPAGKGFPSPLYSEALRRNIAADGKSRNDIRKTASVFALSSYELTYLDKITAEVNFQALDAGGEFLDYSVLTHQNRLTYTNGFLRLKFEHESERPMGWSHMASIALSGGQPRDTDRYVDNLAPNLTKKRNFSSRALDLSAFSIGRLSKEHHLTFGIDYGLDREELLSITATDETTGDSAVEDGYGNKNFHNAGLFAQWVYKPTKSLGITLGSRADYNNIAACDNRNNSCLGSQDDEMIDGQTLTNRGFVKLSNRAALTYRIPRTKLYTKLLFGSSYKPPSPFQLFRNKLTIFGSDGAPTLRPQSADIAEFLLGFKGSDLDVSANAYVTKVTDMVLFFKEGQAMQARNANALLAGGEASARYRAAPNLSVYASAGLLSLHEVTPQQRDNESAGLWKLSPINATLPGGMYPALTGRVGGNLALPSWHLNAHASLNYTGERDASLSNNQLYSVLDLDDTYSFPAHVRATIDVSTVGLHWLGTGETVFGLSGRTASADQPGFGGIDLPGQGAQLLLSLQQHY